MSRAPHSRGSVLQRIVVKIAVLIVAVAVLVLAGEALTFRITGLIGWRISGPAPVSATDHLAMWHAAYGTLPHADDQVVTAPLAPPQATEEGEWYSVHESGPPQQVESPTGLILYHVGRGPQVPVLPPLPHLLRMRDYQPGVLPPMLAGAAFLSSDDRAVCVVDIAMPFRFRLHQHVGSTREFPPSPTSAGWSTSRFFTIMFVHNVAAWFLVLCWPFLVRDIWALVGFHSYRARIWRREGRCEACGYDLRGSPGTPATPGGVKAGCPECGWNRKPAPTTPPS